LQQYRVPLGCSGVGFDHSLSTQPQYPLKKKKKVLKKKKKKSPVLSAFKGALGQLGMESDQ
jgi:hypothetical protein